MLSLVVVSPAHMPRGGQPKRLAPRPPGVQSIQKFFPIVAGSSAPPGPVSSPPGRDLLTSDAVGAERRFAGALLCEQHDEQRDDSSSANAAALSASSFSLSREGDGHAEAHDSRGSDSAAAPWGAQSNSVIGVADRHTLVLDEGQHESSHSDGVAALSSAQAVSV